MPRRPATRSVVMLAFENAQILDVVGPMQLLAAVNDLHPQAPLAYRLRLLAEKSGPVRTTCGLSLVADGPYRELLALGKGNLDTLIIAGGQGSRVARHDTALIAALKHGARIARRVVSICTGAFLLAEIGALKGRRATTHWASIDALQDVAPGASIDRDAIFVRDGKFWSSAGVTAGMDLTLALIAADQGDEAALTIARWHVMYMIRPGGQSQFSARLDAAGRRGSRFADLLAWISEHLTDDLSVPALADRARLSERSFVRHFKAEIGETPAKYVAALRLEAARAQLSAQPTSVDQVAWRCGYGTAEAMRRAFQKSLKISPGAYRDRFTTAQEALSS